ncbi:acyltransferase family protein [Gryllotalpicola kribbensis]|jgi:fucose 4-O-acetylase-like acetyltransferase|uniref:Acyltransferase family protein n=2 Tax=Gryllotalpicola kribbensis TaxID=993084 RepID=A0ABP8AMK2_9MICO
MAMTATETARQPAPKTKRVPFWDNARWVAVTLVIMGHATLKLISASDVAYAFYLFVYTFQVPVLVLVSGYFAKADPPNGRQLKRLLTDVVIPYLIFQTIWIVIQWAVEPGHPFKLDYTSARWTLWFLIALAIWRLVLPYLAMLKFPFLISVLVSFVSGYASSADDTLSLARVAALLPFFVLGWELRRRSHYARWWIAARGAVVWPVRAVAAALLVTAGVTMYFGIDAWRDLLVRRFLLFDEEYSSFGYDQWWAGFVRLLVIALALVMTCAVLVLVPRRHTFFTEWGSATMYIYLLHTFFLYPIRESGWLEDHSNVPVLAGMVALSIAVSVLLSQPFIRKVFHPLVEPRVKWLFHQRRAPA